MTYQFKTTKNREKKLLEKALQAFKNITGLNMVVEETRLRGNYAQYDALVKLKAKGLDKKFAVEIKRRLTNAILGAIIHQLKEFQHKGILITDYVNPIMAERLRGMDVPFIDTAGNVYINEPPIFIYIRGNKPTEKLQKEKLRRVFQPTGLKVLFAFFCNPNLVNAPYRDIAKAANVALGTVGWVFTDLREMGFLMDMGKRGRKLVNKEKLLELWVIVYPARLRPKLIIGRYTGPKPDWHKRAQLHKYNGLWGGEVGAAMLTKYLKPELITIYVRGEYANLLLANKLKKDPKGNIELLKVFWGFNFEERDIVPPLLVYADLLATGDARNFETAELIYERELAKFVREDR